MDEFFYDDQRFAIGSMADRLRQASVSLVARQPDTDLVFSSASGYPDFTCAWFLVMNRLGGGATSLSQLHRLLRDRGIS